MKEFGRPEFPPLMPVRKEHVRRNIARCTTGCGHRRSLAQKLSHPQSGILDTKEDPWYRGFYADAISFSVQTAVTDKISPEYAATVSDIHQIAIQLRRLQDASVNVLWRPLHEAQDQAFWWGAKGPGPFKALWRLLYDQLTQVEGIHNLLWVFSMCELGIAKPWLWAKGIGNLWRTTGDIDDKRESKFDYKLGMMTIVNLNEPL